MTGYFFVIGKISNAHLCIASNAALRGALKQIFVLEKSDSICLFINCYYSAVEMKL